jgi:hypothetical protein
MHQEKGGDGKKKASFYGITKINREVNLWKEKGS